MRFAGGFGPPGGEALRIEFDTGAMMRGQVEDAVGRFLREKLGRERAKNFILKDWHDPGFVWVENMGEKKNPEKNS